MQAACTAAYLFGLFSSLFLRLILYVEKREKKEKQRSWNYCNYHPAIASLSWDSGPGD
jgi:hypothetical protein